MRYYEGFLECLNQNDLILILLKRHDSIGSKGMTQEEIANALNISVDNVRSGISILRNKYMEEIVDYTFVNEETNFKKKRYNYNLRDIKMTIICPFPQILTTVSPLLAKMADRAPCRGQSSTVCVQLALKVTCVTSM